MTRWKRWLVMFAVAIGIGVVQGLLIPDRVGYWESWERYWFVRAPSAALYVSTMFWTLSGRVGETNQ